MSLYNYEENTYFNLKFFSALQINETVSLDRGLKFLNNLPWSMLCTLVR